MQGRQFLFFKRFEELPGHPFGVEQRAGWPYPKRLKAVLDAELHHPAAVCVQGRAGQALVRIGLGTADPGLFDGERYGSFDYAIPVAQGKYTVTLYFSERYFGPGMPGGGGAGSRVFDVSCNGNTLLKDFDVFKTAGGADRAGVETFHGIEADAQGKLILRFVPVVNYALVDAIEVTNP